MRTLISETTTGHRTIAGTEWPVTNRLEREQIGKRRPCWIITRGLCNGVPDSARSFQTKAEALRQF